MSLRKKGPNFDVQYPLYGIDGENLSVLSLVIRSSLVLTSVFDEAVILYLEKLDFDHLALAGLKDVPNSELKHYLLFQILWTMQPPLRIQTK